LFLHTSEFYFLKTNFGSIQKPVEL
jgi:hypothetical protein